MASLFHHARSWALALFAIACGIAGCSGSGGTGSAIVVTAPTPAPSASGVASATPTPSPSASPTASPTPSPVPSFVPSCNLEGPITDIGPGPNGTYRVSVAVGPGNRDGVALTNLRIRFGFVNTSFISASTPTPPTTFDVPTLTWTIGALPLGGTAQYTIILTMTNLPAQSQGGSTFMQVHEQTTADQCTFSDVDAFQTNL